jgi:dipeptidyl aminopeptidase/acylaminoacyl peptidase
MSAEAMWGLARVGEPALSPDGKSIVVSVSRFDLGADKRSADLWLIPAAGGLARQLTSDAANESGPQWSPDGKWIAFVAKRDADEAAQIYVLPTDGGEARRVTAVATGASDPKWLPDSQRLVFASDVWSDLDSWDAQARRQKERTESKMTARVWDTAPIAFWDRWIDDRQTHLFVIPIAGGTPQAITLGSGKSVASQTLGGLPFDVAPDGSQVAFAADSDTTGVKGNLDIYVVPLAGGQAMNLTSDNPADDMDPLYSPDGRYLAWGRQRIYGFYADKVRLMLRERATGAVRELAAAFDRSAEGLVWSPDSRALYGAIDDAGTRRVYRFDLTGAAPVPLTKANDFTDLDIAGAGRSQVLVAMRQSFSEPATLVRIDPRNGAPSKLSDFNDALLASFDFGPVESVSYKGANDKDIQMWVIKPPGFDPSRKYPVFLILHGGPHNGITDAWTYRWNAHVFASWGYVVAWHNFHGSSGFGQDFADSINPNRADLPYQDTIRAAEWFKAQPWVDGDRMAAGGGSYGGYLAATLLGRDHPFKALIAHAAVYNSYTQIGADYGAGKERFFEHWENPQAFQAYSPHMAAGRFNTPTLVIHGQLDYRVPVNHGIELFNTLQSRGVASRLVYYPNENHWILKPQNSVFWYAQVRQWVERYAPPGGR